MKIRPKIQKYQLGDKFKWYKDIYEDYNPLRYESVYDTERGLVAGDLRNGPKSAWSSNIAGTDPGRYNPTNLPTYNQFGNNSSHYKYASEVEGQQYYKDFGDALVDANGNLTNVGLLWAKDVDKLLPEGHPSRLLNPDGTLKESWTVKLKDAHGRTPTVRTYNKSQLREFINHLRNDLTIGARHNVYLKRGKRYFYVDDDGLYHWVDPNKIGKYQVSEKPVEQGWEGNTYWDDYELIGPKNSSNSQQKDPDKTGGSVEEQHNEYGGFDWNKISEGLKEMYPGLLGAGRLAGTLISNNRIYNEALKGIRPNLMLSYHTHRQIVGDEATKLAYYRRAAQGLTRAARPFTADADRQMAYLMEARRVGDELRAQGDLADNAEIRRTSDESNQHQWDNTKRDTEVANTNIASINQANALKQNLLAQKHASDWSSINNYLLEKETRARQAYAEEQAIQDQLWLLLELQDLANNDTYADLYKKAAEDAKTGLTTSENIKAFNNYKTQLEINRLKNRPRRNSGFFLFAKKGTALEYKKKDDLLYKTARDVVDHFRRISKYASDSYNRRPIKLEKLTSHPKGNTRRYLLGGMAPFVVYTPAPMGGETTMSSQASTSGSGSGKGSGKDESLELVKSLFKEIGGNGLPIDVNLVYDNIQKLFNLSKILGTEMTSNDIASIYLLAMLLLSNIKYSLDSFNKLEQLAANNDALNEFAVTADGLYVVSDKDGILSYEKNLEKIIKEGKNPITNQQLLNMRAYSPNLAFSKGDYIIDNVIANGMGINKIGAQIKALAGNLGSTDGKLEGISQVESGKVKAGLQILSGTQGTPDGYYSVTNIGKDLKGLIKAAVDYISNMLSPSQKAILLVHGGVELNIISFLTSQENYTKEQTISPITGKASDKGLGSGGKGDISSNPLLAMLREIGGMYLNYSLVTKDSNTKLSVNGTFYPLLPKISEDMSIDKMLSVSGIGGIIQGKRGITFGNLEIKPEDLKHIMYSNNGGMVVTLPCKIVNGIKEVNLDVVETYEKAEQKALQVNSDRNSPQFIQTLALELKNEHLDSLLDSNGLPNKNMFGQFLVVEAYTSDKTKFDINSKYVEKIENPDEELELRMSKALSTDNKKSNYALDVKDHWTIFEGTWDDIYKGTVFIPLNNNPNAALNTWGSSAKIGQTTELEELYLISNKSSKFNGNNTLE